ncbi:hypothetical protein C7S20_04640 [Christiangramia fulva]|uniref:DUF2946 domain-containing protein n=1 Tax=Christiangramia fulva TaxID=2126553 RepID=A0A2R3Z2Z1_9FLAO|nr:DUF6660 family protein [Christiangramia fulva]AVR44609.1 hypothetical protein C7S20_04640 [Christiangramia fulva]
MKLVALILSFYFLGLVFIPCEDAAAEMPGDHSEIHKLDNSSHSASTADDCSPLCQCHCCHVHITSFEGNDLELAAFEISTSIPNHYYNLGDDLPKFFFQPPRV